MFTKNSNKKAPVSGASLFVNSYCFVIRTATLQTLQN